MKFFTFQFQLHDLSVPLSASIFLNLSLKHILRDLSPYLPFQELFRVCWLSRLSRLHYLAHLVCQFLAFFLLVSKS